MSIEWAQHLATLRCRVASCERPVKYADLLLCTLHHGRRQHYGDENAKPGRERNRPLGSKRKDSQGYVYVLIALGKPDGTPPVWTREHVHVMESQLGRKLLKPETVHHKNGFRDDNRPENLELWSTAQPYGQRASDKVDWAIEILKLYAPDLLAVIESKGVA